MNVRIMSELTITVMVFITVANWNMKTRTIYPIIALTMIRTRRTEEEE